MKRIVIVKWRLHRLRGADLTVLSLERRKKWVDAMLGTWQAAKNEHQSRDPMCGTFHTDPGAKPWLKARNQRLVHMPHLNYPRSISSLADNQTAVPKSKKKT